jgi:hypothetical protein
MTQERSMPAPLHYAFKYLVNPFMKVILRSPAHGLVSNNLLLLTFRGRKSGQTYTTPVGYTEEEDKLYLLTASPWWRNLRDGAPVTVLLRGESRRAYATSEDDAEAVVRLLARELAAHGAGYLRRRYRIDFARDTPDLAQLTAAVGGRVLITIALDGKAEVMGKPGF